MRYLTETWDRFRQETGKTGWHDFMKAQGYLLHHYVRTKIESWEAPQFLTPEKHPWIFAKAFYQVNNYYGSLYRLKQELDFQLEEVLEAKGGDPEVRFNWLKRGKSRDLVPEGTLTGGIVIQAEMVPGPGFPGVPSLGNLTLRESELILETFSKERLQASKHRIESILGDYVRFKADTYQTYEAAKEESRMESGTKPSSSFRSKEEKAIIQMALTKHYNSWVNLPLPALDGKTPLEAMASPSGRERVEVILKQFEHAEERKKRNGEPYADMTFLRKKLGLASQASRA